MSRRSDRRLAVREREPVPSGFRASPSRAIRLVSVRPCTPLAPANFSTVSPSTVTGRLRQCQSRHPYRNQRAAQPDPRRLASRTDRRRRGLFCRRPGWPPPRRAGGTVPLKEHRQRRLRGRRSQDRPSRQSGRRRDRDLSLTDRRRRTGAVALLAKTRFSASARSASRQPLPRRGGRALPNTRAARTF
jgi:hypothetical protein